MNSAINGVITALVTPFDKGEIDFASLRKLIRAQLDQGIDGFVVNGTTGESPCLNFSEVEKVYEVTKHEVAGAVPLILGVGSNSTRKTCEFTRTTNAWKPDAVLAVVPYYNRPPQRGMIAHFTEIAKVANSPVVLYNVPSRTVASLENASTIALGGVENIGGIKDATGDLNNLERVKAEVAPEFRLLSGDDSTCVDFVARGGHGVIAVASHVIGREMKEALAKAREGHVDEAFKARVAPLLKSLYIEPNPIAVKMALYFMGLIASPELRAPLVTLDERYHQELRTCLETLGKI